MEKEKLEALRDGAIVISRFSDNYEDTLNHAEDHGFKILEPDNYGSFSSVIFDEGLAYKYLENYYVYERIELDSDHWIPMPERLAEEYMETYLNLSPDADILELLGESIFFPKLYNKIESVSGIVSVVEKVEGQALSDAIDFGRFTMNNIELFHSWVKEMVGFSLTKGIFPIDVEPRNIIVRPNGEFCCIDLGLFDKVTNIGEQLDFDIDEILIDNGRMIVDLIMKSIISRIRQAENRGHAA